MMADLALGEGYELTGDPLEADVIVVNTCGFIEDAKRESIDAILDLAEARTRGRCRTLVVGGCLAQRYPEELRRGLEEVDHVIGLGQLETLRHILSGAGAGPRTRRRVPFPTARYGRMEDARRHSAYVKVGDGCSRRCAFCAIPQIRGPGRSRSPGSILTEVRHLVRAGVREINLVSQDTSAYGRDLHPPGALTDLLDSLSRVRGLEWIRVLYLYPDRSCPSLIPLMAGPGPVLPYVDLPLQHVTDRMLRIMRRGHGRDHVLSVLERLRRGIEHLTLRTTFIVGHPGETDEDFSALMDFLQEHRPQRIGILRYSAEESTPSASRNDGVSRMLSYRRYRKATALARKILVEHNRALVGTITRVMIQGPSVEGPYLSDARMASQAPEVDGKVVVARAERVFQPGELIDVRIERCMGEDLLAAPAHH